MPRSSRATTLAKGLFAVLAALFAGLAAATLAWKVIWSPPLGVVTMGVVGTLALAAVAALITRNRLRPGEPSALPKLWLAAGMLLVALPPFDCVARLFVRRPDGPIIAADAVLHHRLVPNQDTVIRAEDFSYRLTTNSLGMRGAEPVAGRAPDTIRILFLGDSFTMGKGVDGEQTFVALLQPLLTRRFGRPVECLNGGCDSYAPVLSRLQLHSLRELDFDHVVHCLDMSDVLQEQAYRGLAVRDAGRITAVPAETTKTDLRRWLIDHTVLISTLLNRRKARELLPTTVDNLVRRINPRLLEHTLADAPAPEPRIWDELFESICGIAADCRARDITYTLVVYPWPHQVGEQEWRTGRSEFLPAGARTSDRSRDEILSRAAAAGLRCIDTFDAFRAGTGNGPLYYDHDMHWTPAGHELIAAELARRLTF